MIKQKNRNLQVFTKQNYAVISSWHHQKMTFFETQHATTLKSCNSFMSYEHLLS